MEKVKIYLDEARSGFVVCQQCGKSKHIEFTNTASGRSGVVKCACGNTFGVVFESRQHYRKQITSYGKCFAARDVFDGALVRVVDISMGGIRFIKMDGRPLQLNEKIRVSFPLGNETIDCAASVQNVNADNSVGVKFISLNDHCKKVLGFFLLP